MIQAVTGQPFEALAQDAPLGQVGTITVMIYDPSDESEGSVIFGPTTDGITEPQPGTYHALLTVDEPGSFMVRWEVDGQVAEEELTVGDPLPSAYPTTAELVAQSQEPALTSLDAEQQDVVRAMAIAAIEDFCQQRLEEHFDTVLVDGGGSDVLYLPKHAQTITALLIDGGDYPASSVVLSAKGDRLHASGDYGLDYYSQALTEVVGEERFPVGFGNVELTGTWGYQPLPEQVERALVWDMEDTAQADASALSDTINVYRKLGVRDIAQGNLQADLRGVPSVSHRVAMLLAEFVWVGPVGALA